MKTDRLIILSLICVLVSCQTGPKKLLQIHRLSLDDPEYLQRIKQPVKLPPLPKGSEIAYLLYDPSTQKTVESKNENLPLIPASTTKVLTTAAALKILGPHYKFKTKLAYIGKIENHQLVGDLYLKGDGDPTLSVSHLKDLVRGLSDHQIQEVRGHFYVDDTETLAQSSINNVNEYSASHNPGIGALSVDYNQVYLNWKPTSSVSQESDLIITPDLPSLNIQLGDKLINSNQNFRLESHETHESWIMSSEIGTSGQHRLPIRSPNQMTALLFLKLCKMNGINLPQPQSGTSKKKTVSIAVHESASLVEIVDRALEFSNNLTSELILLALAKKLAGYPVDTFKASLLLKDWILKNIKKTNYLNLELVNGSGLTPKNRVTPKQFVSILEFVDREQFGDRRFESLLPIAGWKGTLTRRLNLPETAFHVWAKTGSLHYANALTGYLYTLQGKRLIFAILLADPQNRENLNQYPDGIPEELATRAEAWNKQAQSLEDILLRNWIVSY